MVAIALLGGVLLLVAAVAVSSSAVIVDATEKRVLTVFGEYETVLEPGLNFVPPFVSDTYSLSLRDPVEVDLERVQTVTPHGPIEVTGTATADIADAEELLEAADDPVRPVRDVVVAALERRLESLSDPDELTEESLRIAVGAEAPGVRIEAFELTVDDGSRVARPQ